MLARGNVLVAAQTFFGLEASRFFFFSRRGIQYAHFRINCLMSGQMDRARFPNTGVSDFNSDVGGGDYSTDVDGAGFLTMYPGVIACAAADFRVSRAGGVCAPPVAGGLVGGHGYRAGRLFSNHRRGFR